MRSGQGPVLALLPRVRRIARFWRSRRGSVSVLAAAIFPMVVGVAGLVTEYGDGLLVRQKAQRLADVAAYSGAVAYYPASSTTAMTDTVNRIARLNGLATSAMAASIVSSPSGDLQSAVLVTVTTNVPLALASVIKAGNSLPISATSYLEVKNNTTGIPCIVALKTTGTGVTISGGATLTANSCAVASNQTETVSSSMTAPVGVL